MAERGQDRVPQSGICPRSSASRADANSWSGEVAEWFKAHAWKMKKAIFPLFSPKWTGMPFRGQILNHQMVATVFGGTHVPPRGPIFGQPVSDCSIRFDQRRIPKFSGATSTLTAIFAAAFWSVRECERGQVASRTPDKSRRSHPQSPASAPRRTGIESPRCQPVGSRPHRGIV